MYTHTTEKLAKIEKSTYLSYIQIYINLYVESNLLTQIET